MQDYSFQSLKDLSQAFPELKRKKMLHPTTEKRLALLLKDIYPEAYPKSEPGEIPGGRSDLAFYFGNGRYIVIVRLRFSKNIEQVRLKKIHLYTKFTLPHPECRFLF